jgi:hypothetical protein
MWRESIPHGCLDIASRSVLDLTKPQCRHERLNIISQDEAGKFVECLECGEIFESSELDELQQKQSVSEAPPDHSENLSDA